VDLFWCDDEHTVIMEYEDNFDIELDDDDVDLLDANLGDTTSKGSLKTQNTVLKHFNNFMKKNQSIDAVTYPHCDYNISTFKTIESARDIAGRFANFIIDTVGIKKPKCTLNYIILSLCL
jgi:hypothetical protein